MGPLNRSGLATDTRFWSGYADSFLFRRGLWSWQEEGHRGGRQCYVIKPNRDGLLGKIKQFFFRAPCATG